MSFRRPRRAGEVVFAAALLAFSTAAFWQAYGISGFSGLSTAGVFPMLASGAMVLSSLAILARTLAAPKPPREGGPEWRRFWVDVLPWRHIAMLALILLYLAAMPWLGFLVSSAVFLFVTFAYLWRRGPVLSLVLTVFCLAAIYLVFRVVFRVVLPQGSLLQGTVLQGLF